MLKVHHRLDCYTSQSVPQVTLHLENTGSNTWIPVMVTFYAMNVYRIQDGTQAGTPQMGLMNEQSGLGMKRLIICV